MRSTGRLPYVSEKGPTSGAVIPQVMKVTAASCPATAIEVLNSSANSTRRGPSIRLTALTKNMVAANKRSVDDETPCCWTVVKAPPRRTRRSRLPSPLVAAFTATPFRGLGLPAVTSGSRFRVTHRLPQSSNPEISAIVVQSPMFSSVFPKRNLTSQGNGLSSDSASAIAITAPDSNTLGLTERPERYFSASSFGLITSVTKFHHEDSYRGNADQSRATTSYFQPTVPIPTPSTQDR